MALLEKLKIVDKSTEEIGEEIPGEMPLWDEDGDAFDVDPEPDETPPRRKAKVTVKSAAVSAKPVTAKVRKEIGEEIAAYLDMVALTWSLRDPGCATALSDSTKNIAEKLTNILAKNPRLLALFQQAGFLGDWVQLYIATKPVLDAMYLHHVKRESPEGGELGFDMADFPAYGR